MDDHNSNSVENTSCNNSTSIAKQYNDPEINSLS